MFNGSVGLFCHSVDTAHFRDPACWKYFAGVLFNQVFRPQCWELGRPQPHSRILPTHPTCIFTVIASQTCYSATKCLKILLELLDISLLCELTDCSVVLLQHGPAFSAAQCWISILSGISLEWFYDID